MKHWDFLKKKYGIHYSLAVAVRDFGLRYGSQKRGGFGLIKYLLSGIFSGRKQKPFGNTGF